MRNLSLYLSMLVTLVIGSSTLAACSDGGGEKDEPEVLSVNPSSVSLVSNANSSASFIITASGAWTITGQEEWLNISSTSGKGDTGITITALSDNETASNRSCTLTITGKEEFATVIVTQLAGLKSGCEVLISDEVVLANSFAHKLTFGPNVQFFYAGYLSSSSAGWTDDRIIQEMQSSGNAINAEKDKVIAADNLDENTKYYQYYVGFDEKGNRGELVRHPVTTPSSRNAPAAYISDVSYSDTKWYWNTTISATANEYYMVATDTDAAILFYLVSPAEIAMMILDNLSQYTSYVQSSEWNMTRDSNSIFIATWAKKGSNWSPVVSEYLGEINTDDSSSKILNRTKSIEHKTPTITIRHADEYEEARQNLKIKRLP